jgi:hypothetical protein
MTALDRTSAAGTPAGTPAGTTTARYRAAAEAHDIDAMLATFAPDVLLHSPITDRIQFRGHDELRDLLAAVFETISEIRYFADIGDARNRALFFRGRVGSQPVEEAIRVTLDDNALITEMTVFFRPLPGLAALTGALAPRVVERKHGRPRALLAKVLMAPLAIFTRIGDRLIPWFA